MKDTLHFNESFDIEVIDNQIWVATDNGFSIFNASGTQSTAYASLLDKFNEAIYALSTDAYGRIWFSGLQGIGLISSNRRKITWFNSSNNLQSTEFNQNAFFSNNKGWLYFGGINGINAINPASVKPEEHHGDIKLITLYVSDTLFTKGIVTGKPEISLSRHAPHIKGSVFITDYSASDQNALSFFLENYSKDWSPAGADQTFSYFNLPPGKYRLLAKYTNSLSNKETVSLLLSINIRQAFWKTTWFYIISLVFMMTVTFFSVRRMQRIRYQRKIQAIEHSQAIERERLRISRDMHDEVGASLTRIAILSELAKKQHNQQKTDEIIEKISEISGNVVDELSEIIWAMNPKNDSLDRFAAYTRQYVNAYLENTNLKAEIDFPAEIPALSMTSDYRSNIFMVIKEALHNIVKHASASKVTLSLQISNEQLIITITDDGAGFTIPSEMNNLTPDSYNERPGPKGNGLHNMHRRMEDIKRSIHITSHPQKGTKITLTALIKTLQKSH